MSEGDTKELVPLPLEENREQPAKSPRERIDSAVAKVVEEFLIVRETSANELAEVTQIIEDDWEIFTTLFDMAAVRDFDARKVKSSFDLFLIESASVGLNIIQVDRTD